MKTTLTLLFLMMAFAVIGQPTARKVVEKQVEAYNQRDIDAFMATYSSKIAIYLFPDSLYIKNKTEMRARYTQLFESTPDLECMINSRMVLGSTVIDKEYVRMNGQYKDAIAIYQVKQDSIVRVTFVRE